MIFISTLLLLDEPNDWSNESLPADAIIDMWEMAHVKNPSNLMEDLGFNERQINLSRLLGVIDEELQNVHNDREFTPLLRVCKTILNIFYLSFIFLFSLNAL